MASTPDPQLLDLLGAVAGPWPARTSGAVLVRLRSLKPGVAVVQALGVVAGALDPAVLPEVERWVAELPEDDTTRRAVRGLAHLLSIRRTIAQELP